MSFKYIDIDSEGNILATYAIKQTSEQILVDIPDDGKKYKYKQNKLEEDKLSKFQKDIQYQHDAFNEYAREIVYQIQYNTALSNTTLILNLEEQLKAEQQAVIARINAITLEYNGGTT